MKALRLILGLLPFLVVFLFPESDIIFAIGPLAFPLAGGLLAGGGAGLAGTGAAAAPGLFGSVGLGGLGVGGGLGVAGIPGGAGTMSGSLSGLLGGKSGMTSSQVGIMQQLGKIGIGGGQLLGSLFKGKQARDVRPELTDPGQTAMLEGLKKQLRGMRTGSAFNVEKGLIGQAGAATRAKIARNTGGNAAATINAFLRSQAVQNQGLNQVISSAQGRQDSLRQQATALQGTISSRSLDLQMHDMLRKQAQQAQLATVGGQNVLAGLFNV